MQGYELSGLWATSGRPPQPCVPLEEVVKTSTAAGQAALAPAAVKIEESPPAAPPARLKFEPDDEGRVRGKKRPRQPTSSSSSWNLSSTTSSREVKEVNLTHLSRQRKRERQRSTRGKPQGRGRGEGNKGGGREKGEAGSGEGGRGGAAEGG